MDNEEIAGYLVRLELENGEDRFWNLSEEWVEDPGDAELFELEEAAETVVSKLKEDNESLDISIEEVIYDDEEEEPEED